MKFGCDCVLRDLLSDALRQAVSEYADFAATPHPAPGGTGGNDKVAQSVKDLPARHAAGKIMVGHITALAKLVHWWSAAGAEAPADAGAAVPDMVAAARNAVSRYAADED